MSKASRQREAQRRISSTTPPRNPTGYEINYLGHRPLSFAEFEVLRDWQSRQRSVFENALEARQRRWLVEGQLIQGMVPEYPGAPSFSLGLPLDIPTPYDLI